MILQITGSTGITGTGKLLYKSNDVVIQPSITLEGLTIEVQFRFGPAIKWTDKWNPIESTSLYTGPDIVVIKGP